MDARFERLINAQWTNPLLDRLMAAMSSLALWAPFLIVAAALVAWWGNAHARWFLATLALGLILSDGLVAQTLKRVTHRPRPFQEEAGIREIDLTRHAQPRLAALWQPLSIGVSSPDPKEVVEAEESEGRSFPSAHTMNNFCAATILALFYRRWGWLYFGPALMVAYSRIYVGAHWPSDVLFSIPLAVAVACLAVAFTQSARRRLS